MIPHFDGARIAHINGQEQARRDKIRSQVTSTVTARMGTRGVAFHGSDEPWLLEELRRLGYRTYATCGVVLLDLSL